jgi:hypothetical protein
MLFNIRVIMSVALFSLGLLALWSGIWTIVARDYRQTLRTLAAQSSRIHNRGLTEIGIVPIIDASARLIEAINSLIRTAMGVGAFLCLVGLALSGLAYFVLVQ